MHKQYMHIAFKLYENEPNVLLAVSSNCYLANAQNINIEFYTYEYINSIKYRRITYVF